MEPFIIAMLYPVAHDSVFHLSQHQVYTREHTVHQSCLPVKCNKCCVDVYDTSDNWPTWSLVQSSRMAKPSVVLGRMSFLLFIMAMACTMASWYWNCFWGWICRLHNSDVLNLCTRKRPPRTRSPGW